MTYREYLRNDNVALFPEHAKCRPVREFLYMGADGSGRYMEVTRDVYPNGEVCYALMLIERGWVKFIELGMTDEECAEAIKRECY
jgi:hypothetical protein